MDYQPLLVPLIPADLLPEYVELEGVSRYLTLAEIRGMTSVGTMDLAGEKYHVKFNLSGDPVLNDSWGSINDVKGADETGPAGNLKSTFSDIRQNSTQEFGQFQPNSNEVRRSGILQDTSLSSIASSGGCLRSSCQNVATGSPSSEPAPGFLTDQTIDHIRSGSAAKASRKTTQYCKFWCHYPWSCKYGKHCKKKHQMPSSPKTLHALGLEGFPQWWVDYMHTERLPERPSQEIIAGKGSFTKADSKKKSGYKKRKAAHTYWFDRGSPRTRACGASDFSVGTEVFNGRMTGDGGHDMSHEATRGIRVDNEAGGDATEAGSVVNETEKGNLIDFLEDNGVVQINSSRPPGYYWSRA